MAAAGGNNADDVMIVDEKDEVRTLTAPVPPRPSLPLPTHLLVLLSHIISLCESVSKCHQQFRRYCQNVEDLENVNSFRQLRSAHNHCPIMVPEHLSEVVTLCKEAAFSIDKFASFDATMDCVFKGVYFMEAPEVKFLRSQFRFAFSLIKQARFEMSTLMRFNFPIVALLDTPRERNAESWHYAVSFFPYILELAQSRWKMIATSINTELEKNDYLPTLFVSTSLENLMNKFMTMIDNEPKAFILGGNEDFSDDSSLSGDSDGTFAPLREQRRYMIFDMKHALKTDCPVDGEGSTNAIQ